MLKHGDFVEIYDGSKPLYGNFLAQNSAGNAVIEVLKDGKLSIIDTAIENVAKVMPYTVAVVYADGAKRYHYVSKDGEVEVGDVLLLSTPVSECSIARVVDVDTKNEYATKRLQGHKLVTVNIGDKPGED